MSRTIIGTKVSIRKNEFVGQDLSATIVTIEADNKSILLKLDKPLEIASTTYLYVIAIPRSAKDSLDILIVDGTLGCSVTWVPEEEDNLNEPMDLSWWRGGAAAITDLYTNSE